MANWQPNNHGYMTHLSTCERARVHTQNTHAHTRERNEKTDINLYTYHGNKEFGDGQTHARDKPL